MCAAQFKYTRERKLQILDRLAWSEMFESFLANKFAAAKRFGLEGCETLIPGMKALIDRSTEQGVESIVMGMPHRGKYFNEYPPAPPIVCRALHESTSLAPLAIVQDTTNNFNVDVMRIPPDARISCSANESVTKVRI